MPAHRSPSEKPGGDTSGPRAHEDTWGANPDAKEKFAAANPSKANDTATTEEKAK